MAKKKMRRDVLIYRIVFACMCLAIILLITAIVVTIVKKSNEKDKELNPPTQTQSMVDTQENKDSSTEETTEPTEEESMSEEISSEEVPSEEVPSEEVPSENTGSGFVQGAKVKALAQLNLRQEPSTEAAIIGGVQEGQIVDVLADEGDWIKVDINGTVGYIAKRYVELQ